MIKLRDNLYTYFINKWGMYDYTRGWLKGNCPYCGKENKFGVNLASNKAHCFVCDERAKPISVVAYIERASINEAMGIIRGFEGLAYIEPTVVEYERQKVILPEGYHKLTEGDSQIARSARNYIKNKRGLDVRKLSEKGFGYCDKGDLFGYIIMPFYLRGQLVYYQARNFMANGPKFNNPKIEDFGIGKSVLIYNYDSLWLYDSTHLVESVFNAETIGDNSVGLLGKSIAPWQWSAIISSPVKRVTILLDPDAYYEKALPLALSIAPYKLVKVINLPDGQDVNSYGRTRTMQLKRKTHYQSYSELLKLKHEFERNQFYE